MYFCIQCRVCVCVKGWQCKRFLRQKAAGVKVSWCKSSPVNKSGKKLVVEKSFGVYKFFGVNGFLLCENCFGTGARGVLCEKGGTSTKGT